ncbi:MAG: HsdM family class I SAM-dependent methyltransferase [Candidatus Helarchaeota archaeon]
MVLQEKQVSFVETPQEIANLMVQLITKQKDCNILDTGCGTGVFLKVLLEKGFTNIEGIELSSTLAKRCKSVFNEAIIHKADFLTWNSAKRYDLIIGNPPYAHFNSLPFNIQQEVFNITKTRESDIYYAFILKAIDILNPNGELIYIVPYGFFYNTHAKIVRKKLLEAGTIQVLIDLDETHLFQDEHPETIIFKFVKEKLQNPPPIQVLRIKKRNAPPTEIFQQACNALKMKMENTLFYHYQKEQFDSYREIWSTFSPIKIPEFIMLKNIAFIGVGLVSGFDLAFRILNAEDLHFTFEEKQLISRFVKAVHCKGYWLDGFAKYILIDNTITEETQLSNFYPNIYKKLIVHKEEMNTRYLPNKKKWFHWQALRNKATFEKFMKSPKIFIPTLDRSPVNRFSLSYEEVYPSGDVLCIIPRKIDPYFLLGYLNSTFFRKYYLAHGARRGHRIAFTQRILSNIKIPSFEQELINEIKEITKEIVIKRNQVNRILIDEIIHDAFKQNRFEKHGLYQYV